jgi:hypothetical protein
MTITAAQLDELMAQLTPEMAAAIKRHVPTAWARTATCCPMTSKPC